MCVQEEKKEIAAVKAADRALLDKCSLDIELVPEEEEDQRLAGLIKYSVTKCKIEMTPTHRMSGSALIWLSSYLCGVHKICIVSQPLPFKHSVPQVSVLGLVLSTHYTPPLLGVIKQHD